MIEGKRAHEFFENTSRKFIQALILRSCFLTKSYGLGQVRRVTDKGLEISVNSYPSSILESRKELNFSSTNPNHLHTVWYVRVRQAG